ncbi:uncharacterized protein LOC110885168 isoform X2 [Helianthus annuus]|uniref:uncharacterized protein LOC110885168 isoform X2 n=1 Tax=Helianthus annuus TaxID=4232 RepID=UPI00165323B6|nr:uncharacterized protein LOC110885168 isoform X2 [Helianthus annuus]
MLVTYFHLFRFQQVLGLETEIRMLKSLDLESLIGGTAIIETIGRLELTGSSVPCCLPSRLGANKSVCAPDPYDVGRILQVDIISNAQKSTVTTDCPIQPDVGLVAWSLRVRPW